MSENPPPPILSELLKLSADERIEIALALWESLTDPERDSAFTVTPEQIAELDRRRETHLRNPELAISWEELRRRLGRKD